MMRQLLFILIFPVFALFAEEAPSFMAVGVSVIDLHAQVSEEFLKSNVPGRKGSSIHCSKERFQELIAALGSDCQMSLGGSAGNTARAMANLGIPTRFLSIVGEDPRGNEFLKEMNQRKISGIIQDPQFSTLCMLALITPDGERTFLHHQKMADWNSFPESEKLYRPRWIHLEGYLLWDAPSVIAPVFELAQSINATVSVDLANFILVEQYKDKILSWLGKDIDVLIGNEEEIKTLTGKAPEEACKELSQKCALVVVTKGSAGSVIGYQQEIIQVPAFSACVVDTTAAGDYFTAGFIYGCLNNLPLSLCAKIGHRLGSAIIESRGTELPEEKWNYLNQILREDRQPLNIAETKAQPSKDVYLGRVFKSRGR